MITWAEALSQGLLHLVCIGTQMIKDLLVGAARFELATLRL